MSAVTISLHTGCAKEKSLINPSIDDGNAVPKPRRWMPITFERPNFGRRDRGLIRVLSLLFLIYCFTVLSYYPLFTRLEKNSGNNTSKLIAAPHEGCETIHLATVCGGFRSTRDFYILIKSILFHRRAYKLHYHLFVDNISWIILSKLFETWRVPDLELSFYNVTDYEQDVSWIPNTHYSNRYGLLKLIVPSILSSRNVTKVILLDTDMVALGDVRLVWKRFADFEGSTSFLGLVENQSDWYLSRRDFSSLHIRLWPAIGRGYNTGLMLIDVAKARINNWDELWHEVAETELVALLSTNLADQDIYNAVIKKNAGIVTKLPCYLNIQLNNHTSIDESCRGYQDQEINIVHWNTPNKLKTNNYMAEYFRGWYITFQDWNGKLLERDGCPKSDSNTRGKYQLLSGQDSSTWGPLEPCAGIRPRPEDLLRTFLFYKDFELGVDADSEPERDGISAVVHLSMDRFQALEDFAARWFGPISAAIYLKESETSLLVSLIEESDILAARKNIGYHLVFMVFGWHYPINRMRNIALENAITPYVFLSDIDFLPSNDLYSYLKRTIRDMARDRKDSLDKRALVIAAFENHQYKSDFPNSKAELMDQLDLGNITTFRDRLWPKGQAQTDYAKWKHATKPYTVEWRADYEPFIVASRNLSKFDERFIGFGWNKVEHDMTLAAEGYEFLVLPEAFMIHQDHTASRDIKYYRLDQKFHSCINHLKEKVKHDLKQHFPAFKQEYVHRMRPMHNTNWLN